MGRWYFRLLDDITSSLGKRTYAYRGEICALHKMCGVAWIMENNRGQRFPINESMAVLNVTKTTNDEPNTKTPGTLAADGLPPGKKQQPQPHGGSAPHAQQRQYQPPAAVSSADPFPGKPGPAARKQKGSHGTGSAGSKKAAEKSRDHGTLFGE